MKNKTDKTMWTHFWDMNSGGKQKEKFEHLYIEAPRNIAEIVFYNRFGHAPDRVTCTCCGEDYSVTEGDSLEQLTGYQRGCLYKNKKYFETPDSESYVRYVPLEKYLKKPDVAVVLAEEIKDSEKVGKIPKKGWIWVD